VSDYRARFEKITGELPTANSANEVSIHCPFHDDMKKSASLNLKTGLFFCMACEASHNYIGFKKAWQEEHGYPDQVVPETEATKAIPDNIVSDLHQSLLSRPDITERLANERGVSIAILKEWEIGWHERTGRVAIPIRDENGVCVNVRLYSFTESGTQKMLSWRQGFGTARLWPLEAFEEPYVFLCEGEMDRLVLADRGINAVTSTGGAKTWKSEWSKWFDGLQVRIVYDMDRAGDEGARKAAGSIAEHALEVKIIRLDLTKAGEDITDYFVNYGYGIDDLRELSAAAPIYKKPIDLTERDTESGQWVTLGQSLLPAHRNAEVMVPVIVASRRDERLHYPRETMFTCNQDAGKFCTRCTMYGSGEATVSITSADAKLLNYVGVSEVQQRAATRTRLGIPSNCKVVESQVTESGTIEEILITPEIDTARTMTDASGIHLIQRAFYVGLGLDYNASYALKLLPVPFHKNNKIVHQVVEATPARDSIESFEMSPVIFERLQVFQAEPGKARTKLGQILKHLQNHVTRVWDRLDLHMAMDLVWHSVLEFELDGQRLDRGWLEACIIGDTRTGKSEIAKRLLRFYGLGELVSGENTSLAGLVGGAVKVDEAWFVKWGRLPLNDRRLIVIDEVTGMPIEEIARMSDVRDSGVATITKIETQRAPARTRAIWIGNVRPTRGRQELGDYDYGCHALHDLLGMPEDIARFDYAAAAARSEVDPEIVNRSHDVESDMPFDSEKASALVLWAWSRSRDTIQFQREAVEGCYRHAVEMGEIYDAAVPLVMAENQRVKIARIAAAAAARLFSTDDGENLIVTAEHVDLARWFLDKLYSKPSFGYTESSRRHQFADERRKRGYEEVEDHLRSRPELADFLTRTKILNPRKVATYTGVPEDEAEASLRVLSKNMMIMDKGSHGYAVTTDLQQLAQRVVPIEYQVE